MAILTFGPTAFSARQKTAGRFSRKPDRTATENAPRIPRKMRRGGKERKRRKRRKRGRRRKRSQ